MIEIYTDGACKGNPGPGGWAALVIEHGKTAEYVGYEPQTTNQRMEVTAAIEGLRHVPAGAKVTLYSDSEYVVNTMTKNWKRRANLDLWPQLDREVAARAVTFKWERGHNGHPIQERADELASAAAMGGTAPVVSGGALGGAFRGKEQSEHKETTQQPLSHLDDRGRARMVDVGEKADTEREAVAKGRIVMQAATLELLRSGHAAKGDVLAVARVAGIMAAKKTPEFIPLAHGLMLTSVVVEFEMDEKASAVEIRATVRTKGKTGVEMEALTAVAVAGLTIYDMLKAVDRGMRIEAVRLVKKSGGKSGDFVAE